MNLPKVSIIFPNYNGGKEPLDCIKSIKNLNYPKEKIAIITIDNGSTDGSSLKIQKKFPEVILIKNKKNLGFAKAINQGIKLAKGQYIFITNDDIVFEKNSLKNLINYSQKLHDLAVLGGKIYLKSNPQKLASCGYHMNPWTGNVGSYQEPNIIKEPEWIPGCAMLVPRKILAKVGLLDDNFTYSFDDFDYCLRVKKAGFKVVYLPQAIFWHGESTTANRNRKLKHYGWYQSKLRFAIKNLSFSNIISILFCQILTLPYIAVTRKDHRVIPFAKALLWNLQNLRKTLKYRKR